jgi:hypothetical protein
MFAACSFALAMASLSIATAQPAAAEPSGTTTTFEIGVGAALLANLIKLQIDEGRSDRDGRQAMALMLADQDGGDASALSFRNGSDQPPPATLRALRLQILTTAISGEDKRVAYEALRRCWNKVVSPEPSSAPTAAPAAPSAALRSYPEAAGQSKAPDAQTNCASQSADEHATIGALIDEYDASVAFANAPSLWQQVVDDRIGSHAADNQLRLRTLFMLGEVFLGYQPPSLRGPTLFKANEAGTTFSLQDAITDCVSTPSLFGCIQQIGAAEQSVASDHRTAIACGFTRLTWLPSYTAVTMARKAGPIDENTTFGDAPGC